MKTSVWTRPKRAAPGAAGVVGEIARAAAAGESLPVLIELGARNLLIAGDANRAGLWLPGEGEKGFEACTVWEGLVMDAEAAAVPREWGRLEVSTSALQKLLRSGTVTEWGSPRNFEMPSFPPLLGMHRVLWVPLRAHGKDLGLAMVAFCEAGEPAQESPVQSVACELSLALAERLSTEKTERLEREWAARDLLQRMILRGKPATRVWPQIASEAIRHTPAEFVALGRNLEGRVRWETSSGPPEWAALLEGEIFKEISRGVCGGREAVVRELPAGNGISHNFGPRPTVLALPLEAGGEFLGVLVGGFRNAVDPSRVLARLAPYAALAAQAAWGGPARSQTPGEKIRGYLGAEDSRQRLAAELHSVLDAVDTGVLLLDGTGRIRFANAWLAQLLGLESRRLGELKEFTSLAAMVGERFRDPRAFARPGWELCQRAGEAARVELELVRPARKLIERSVRPVLDPAGHRLGWLELYRDITSQRLIQSKLLQTEKMAAIGQLVSGIAHELNNPLAGILGYAQLLLGHGLSSKQLAEAQKIYQEAEHARHIVKNLLMFAREAKLERSAVDLNEVVERTLALRSYELKVEDIVTSLDLAADLPQTRADPIQLQQVVLNLLINSEQAILQSRGHGHIRVRTRRLAGNRLSLEVSDDGPGIAPEIASRIFDPFFTTKPPGVGTGLGLSTVYGIVQQHGGDIYLESQPGRGATFVVELPVVEVTADAPVSESGERPGAAVGSRRVLVVEDEPTVAQLVADVLGEEHHEVEMVLDSQEGLNRLAQKPFDAVICDLRMPRLDGQAFYHALAAAGSPVREHLLFITGDTMSPGTVEFLERNSLPYLAKPFLVEELKLAVNKTLGPGLASAGSAGGSGNRRSEGKR